MKLDKFALVAALNLALTGALTGVLTSTVAAQAARPTKDMAMGGHDAAKTGSGVGVVKAIDVNAGTVTIQHQPIAAIGWPAMTMAFKASPSAQMRSVKVGQSVRFSVRVQGDEAEVTRIAPD